MTIVQSAKVYVLDFHFKAHSKEAISRKKKYLDEYFKQLRDILEAQHQGTVVEEVFLRVH